jgi:hypothetical protein
MINKKVKKKGIRSLLVFFLKKGNHPPYVLKKSPDNTKYKGIRKRFMILMTVPDKSP